MWLMTTRGFYSAVAHRDDPTKVMVRARTEEDLNALIELIPGAKATFTPNADYQWRITIAAAEWANALTMLALDVDYPNFKNAVADPKHHSAYTRVWGVMYDALDSRARGWFGRGDDDVMGTPHVEYDSIDDWALDHGLTLDEALEAGVTMDADGVVYVPPGVTLPAAVEDTEPISFVTPIRRSHEEPMPFFDPPETAA